MAEALRANRIQRTLACVAERRMPKIMPQCDGLHQIFVQAQGPRDGPRDLRNLQRMGQPRAVVVALRGDEDLCLVGQAAECLGVDDAVAVARKAGADGAWLNGMLAASRAVSKRRPSA